jgi:ribosomal protein S18 acetylase RimI-like enzyme
MFETLEIREGKDLLCREILNSLPEWFGIPEAIDAYVEGVKQQPMLICKETSKGSIVGFLSLRLHTPFATEAYVLGIRREWHRQGCGTMLFNAASELIRTRGARFLTVKTLAATNPDPNYTLTRQFYEKIGFLPIEVFASLWGAQNPCLLMIKLV